MISYTDAANKYIRQQRHSTNQERQQDPKDSANMQAKDNEMESVMKSVIRVMEKRGPELFNDRLSFVAPDRIEATLRDAAIEDGTIKKDSAGTLRYDDDKIYNPSSMRLYNMAINISRTRMEMAIEQGLLPAKAKDEFYNAGGPAGATSQAHYAAKVVKEAEQKEKLSKMQDATKNIDQKLDEKKKQAMMAQQMQYGQEM